MVMVSKHNGNPLPYLLIFASFTTATTPPSTPSSPSSSQATQSTGAPPSSISLNIIIGAAVGGAVVLILIIMIIVIFILCFCRRRMTHYPIDNIYYTGHNEPDYDSPDYNSGVTLARTENIGLKSKTAYAGRSITMEPTYSEIPVIGGGEAETAINTSEGMVTETNTAYGRPIVNEPTEYSDIPIISSEAETAVNTPEEIVLENNTAYGRNDIETNTSHSANGRVHPVVKDSGNAKKLGEP